MQQLKEAHGRQVKQHLANSFLSHLNLHSIADIEVREWRPVFPDLLVHHPNLLGSHFSHCRRCPARHG